VAVLLALVALAVFGPHVLNGGFMSDDWALQARWEFLRARQGFLPALRVGPRRHYVFDPEAIEALLASASWGREVDAAHTAEAAAPAARRGPATTTA